MHHRSGGATLTQLAFPGESNPNFPREKPLRDNTVSCNTLQLLKKKKKIMLDLKLQRRCLENNYPRGYHLTQIPNKVKPKSAVYKSNPAYPAVNKFRLKMAQPWRRHYLNGSKQPVMETLRKG